MNIKGFLEKICVMSVLGLIAVVFLGEIIQTELLTIIQIILLILLLTSGIILARGIALYFSLAALMIGHILFFSYKMDQSIWLEGITKNLPLGILLVTVPLLSIPLKQGGYLETINYYVFKYLDRTCSLFGVLSGFIFIFSSITNLGGIRVTKDLLEEAQFPPKFLAKVFTTGFGACVAWSPYYGSVNLVLYYTGVSFGSYFIYGIILGLLFLGLGNLLFYKDLECQREVRLSGQNLNINAEDNGKIKELAIALAGLLSLVIVGEKLLDLSNMMLLVSLIALFYAAVWSLLINRFKGFLLELKGYHKVILQFKNEVVFFLSVGFFGIVMAKTPFQYLLQDILGRVSNLSTFFLVEFIIIITVLLSSIGFHQVITITTLAFTINPALIGLNDLTFSLTLMAAWTVCIIMSPFVPYNILLGGLIKENSFTVGLKWNRTFGIIGILLSGAYIVLINSL
ncbi:MAG: hypothetical protein VR72_12995 [Clostridiaceae bacterium BRH_c20a]|nr:MAG: hypothetical protein VR72_12995 [Clostridiaceae bacterium BRH_c20a]